MDNSAVDSNDKKDILREGVELMIDLQLKELEKYVKEDQEADMIYEVLQNQHTSEQLAEVSIKLFQILMMKVSLKLEKYKERAQVKLRQGISTSRIEFKSQNESNYDKLEKQIQKYEAEIRNHISVIDS